MREIDLCAIDMGQTNVRWVIIDNKKEIMRGETGEGVTNVLSVGGLSLFKKNLSKIIEESYANLGKVHFKIISAGVTGISEERIDFSIVSDIFKEFFVGSEIILNSDIYSTYLGNFKYKEGIILHAGTGSFAFGRDKLGKTKRIGGWGYLLGDEGGGYWIGLEGVKAAIKSYEGVFNETILTRSLLTYFKIDSISELKPIIYNENFKTVKIADFAKEVFSASEKRDKIAMQIIKKGGEYMANLILPLVHELNFDIIHVKLVGAIYVNEKLYFDITRDSIRSFLDCLVETGESTSLDGAIWLGEQYLYY